MLFLCYVTDCGKPYVTMNPNGRLGNMICQYASLYLLRHLHGVRVCSIISFSQTHKGETITENHLYIPL